MSNNVLDMVGEWLIVLGGTAFVLVMWVFLCALVLELFVYFYKSISRINEPPAPPTEEKEE